MIETPEDKRIKVFKRGIFMGLKGEMEFGGQISPNSIFGEMLLWKKAQKNEKKNRTSDVINKIIPNLRPFRIKFEWRFSKVLSRIMSRHHK